MNPDPACFGPQWGTTQGQMFWSVSMFPLLNITLHALQFPCSAVFEHSLPRYNSFCRAYRSTSLVGGNPGTSVPSPKSLAASVTAFPPLATLQSAIRGDGFVANAAGAFAPLQKFQAVNCVEGLGNIMPGSPRADIQFWPATSGAVAATTMSIALAVIIFTNVQHMIQVFETVFQRASDQQLVYRVQVRVVSKALLPVANDNKHRLASYYNVVARLRKVGI
eukprot:m.61410 g.61410  ORF g.61410 m.61410 type:complete len:221 (-) comp22977_c0_seq2:36-698(-)